MNKPGGGFSLIEMLIVVAIIAVLAGVGSSYYQEYSQEARISVIKSNLLAVRDAVSRYFKDRLAYPRSFEELQGAFLKQSVQELLINPIPQGVVVDVEVANDADPNRENWSWSWMEYDFVGAGSGNRQMRNVRIKYNGSVMNW